jgi:hypothetical protein
MNTFFAIWQNANGYSYGHMQHLKVGDLILATGTFDEMNKLFNSKYK